MTAIADCPDPGLKSLQMLEKTLLTSRCQQQVRSILFAGCSGTTEKEKNMNKVNHIPAGFQPITPYLIVKGAAEAIRFYQQAFCAIEVGRITTPDGVIGHAELKIDEARLMLSEEMPAWKNKSPRTLGGTSVGIVLYVPDVDTTFQRALDAGATQVEPLQNQFYGDRAGMLTDPFGHNWYIMTHIEDVSFPETQRRSDAMFVAQH
ncbi:MAG: VOC family protein [Gallionellaceae bacterium]|jgi:PhnB protein